MNTGNMLQSKYKMSSSYLWEAHSLALKLNLPIQLRDNKRLFAELLV